MGSTISPTHTHTVFLLTHTHTQLCFELYCNWFHIFSFPVSCLLCYPALCFSCLQCCMISTVQTSVLLINYCRYCARYCGPLSSTCVFVYSILCVFGDSGLDSLFSSVLCPVNHSVNVTAQVSPGSAHMCLERIR